MKVVAAPDKFRGTGTAREVAAAIGRAATAAGADCVEIPMADGGEGLLDVLGGPDRTTVVTGPLGAPVEAGWRLDRGTAVIEMARVAGLELAGGADGNHPLDATTAGVGELILSAVESGAQRIVIGMGGSATTDGGLGALDAMGSPARYRGVELLVACDVRTRFADAAEVFGPQKGATDAHVRMLTGRLERLVQVYGERFDVDVSTLDRAGAAGGLAGGLAAMGAELVDGIDLVAEELRLDEHVADADLVVTGEGWLDATSYEGKVVGGVGVYAAAAGVPLLVVVGGAEPEVADRDGVVSLSERFGMARAMAEPTALLEIVIGETLARG
ncbi:MAG: glycerate kinase [Acidimicrobiaceae bacterium]|jgi:glycerate 2-kinase|nr:glycerate kinase [Acidimicrobiaceae bacterium]